MAFLDFYNYSPQKELPGGEYWQLLQITDNDLLNTIIDSPSLCFKLLNQIQNPTLKQQLKSKFVSLLNLQGYDFFYCLDPSLFSLDEIKDIVSTALNIRLNNYSGEVSFFLLKEAIYFIQRINDIKWQKNEIDKIFDLLSLQTQSYYPSRPKAISNLILSIRDTSLKNQFIQKYSEELPLEYLNLIKIESDPEYISKKSKNFRHVCIGINPEIKLGAEIELNHKTFGTGGFRLTSQKNIGQYISSSDATVPNGDEFTSPIFHDTPEELSVFCAVCDTLKELGYEAYDINVAGQINIGIDYLNTAESLLQFWELFCNSEELLYHICNPEGSIMRQHVYNNSRFKAVSGAIGTRIIPEDISREEVIRMLSADKDSTLPGIIFKKNSICLRDGNRFEIRIPNGSEDYRVWIDNIRLFAKMVEVSKTLSNVLEGTNTSAASIQKLELKEALKDSTISLEEKLFVLMDLLFDDDKIKEIYVNRFYSLEAEILKTGTRIYEPTYCISDSGFDVVDFQRVYNSQVSRSDYGCLKVPNMQSQIRDNEHGYRE